MTKQDNINGNARWRWVIIVGILLIGIDIIIHLIDIIVDAEPSSSWIPAIIFYILLIPLYYLASLNILRENERVEKQNEESDIDANAEQTVITDVPQEVTVQENTADHLSENDVTSTINQWIARRYFTDANITVDKVLEQTGISINVLNYYLEGHAESGSFRKWLSYLRVEEAKRLMIENPNFSLQAIAEACGYANNASLSRSFKAQEGITPSEWFSRQREMKRRTTIANTTKNIKK